MYSFISIICDVGGCNTQFRLMTFIQHQILSQHYSFSHSVALELYFVTEQLASIPWQQQGLMRTPRTYLGAPDMSRDHLTHRKGHPLHLREEW